MKTKNKEKMILIKIIVLFIIFSLLCSYMIPFRSFAAKEKDEILKDEMLKDEENTKLKEENIDTYSESYKRYLELSDEEKSKMEIIPRKNIVPFNNYDEEDNSNRTVESDYIPQSYILTGQDNNNDGRINSNDVSVERYGNLRIDFEDQDEYGLCWAFSSINALETYLDLNNKGRFDFSEIHLDYISFMNSYFPRNLHEGGNFEIFRRYEEDGAGVVLEEEAPYYATYDTDEGMEYLRSLKQRVMTTNLVDMPTIDKYNHRYYENPYSYTPQYLTQDILNQFRNRVKRHIMENGALYATIYSPDITYSNSIGKFVLNSKSTNIDHAITIIGWDDNFSKYNFPTNCRPSNNGAYIALNSWNASIWEGNCIFYISYEDYNVEAEMSGVEGAYVIDPLYISIEHEPYQLNYIAGEEFNSSGMIIKAHYADNSERIVYDYEILPQTLDIDDEYVTISYTEGEITQTVTQAINVFSSKAKIRRQYLCLL